ncbi:MAG: hypothetical protein IKX60_06960 [Bacteroidales bacterium]|nr:hypothetical protein [Bacteroidales bacterium]
MFHYLKSKDNNKLLFILPALPEYAPYLQYYIKIANECSFDFDVICWNRKGEENAFTDNYYVYNHPTSDSFLPIKKMMEIYGFCHYVRKIINRRYYRCIFTFTIADSVFLAFYLKRRYKGKYIFDIRDYSPVANSRLFKKRLDTLLCNSAANVISSEGFKRWLPSKYKYITCHNTDIDKIKESINHNVVCSKKEDLSVLTIGALRDIFANKQVIDAFANQTNIVLNFIGDGNATPFLKQYCEDCAVKNAFFYGRYKKEEEDGFVSKCDIMNLVMSHNIVSDYLMSNRFYLAVRFRKPIIVNDKCFQAEQVRKYGLGLVVSDFCQLKNAVESYWDSLNMTQFNDNCLNYLKLVYNEQASFRSRIKLLILGNKR